MMSTTQPDDPLAVLARLASDTKGTQKRLQDLAKATLDAETAKREAEVAVKEADARLAEAQKKEHINLRRIEQAHQKETENAQRATELDERERVHKADTAKTRADLKVQEDSLTQREAMLEESKAATEKASSKAAKDLEKGKALKDKFTSMIARIGAIANEV